MSDTKPIPNSKRALAEALLKRKGKRAERWSESDKAKIFGQYLGGAHPADIGAQHGVSGQTITNLIKRAIKEGLEES
jgi:transposase-like protein